MDPELRTEFRRVGEELRETKEAFKGTWRQTFVRGLIYGSGFVIGSAAAIAIGSWLLSVFGVIPGLGEIAQNLREILQTRTGF